MKFKDFKTEIIDRCKNQSACQSEFKRVLDSKNYKELIPVLTDNFWWSCNHKIIDVELLKKVGNETLNKFDLAVNISVTKGFLLAGGNSTVKAWDNSTVEAWGNSTVEAWDNSTVKAGGNSTVKAWDNSTVKAGGNSTVKAWGNSTVEAWGNSTVEAWGNSTVEAWGNSTVEAGDNSYINSLNTIEHKLSDKAICRYYHENKIVLSKSSEIKKY